MECSNNFNGVQMYQNYLDLSKYIAFIIEFNKSVKNKLYEMTVGIFQDGRYCLDITIVKEGDNGLELSSTSIKTNMDIPTLEFRLERLGIEKKSITRIINAMKDFERKIHN